MREAQSAAAAVVVLLWLVLAAADESVTSNDRPGRDDDVGPLGRLAGSLRDRMLDVVGPDEIVERVDIDAVLERVDVDSVLARVDVNRLLARVDVNAVLARVEPGVLLARVDVDALLARVDVNRLLARVDVNAVLARVEPDVLLARVDIDALLARVDVNRLLARVDVEALLARVDIDRLLARVDMDAVIDAVDVERVVQRAGIPEIVAESTGTVAESVLDLLRRQLLGLDVVLTRAVTRALSRDELSLPAGPEALVGDGGPEHSLPAPNAPTVDVSGHYAGGVTRLAAFVTDGALAVGAFTVAGGALGSTLRAAGLRVDQTAAGGILFAATSVLWLFMYWWASTAVAGRTPGMAIVGLRVVTRGGLPVSGRRAFVRVVFIPVSLVFFGLGLVGIVFDRERRALHDVVAGTSVVYDWGDRSATMPTPLARWLARRQAAIDDPPRPPGSPADRRT